MATIGASGIGRGRAVAQILGIKTDSLSLDVAIERILVWSRIHESRYVTVSNVHVVVTASRDASYGQVINGADMAIPDGAPIAWMLRRLGFANQSRISGPDLMWELCKKCAIEGLSVFFYGSTEATLTALNNRLLRAFPNLLIEGLESPPFRSLTVNEDAAITDRINASGTGIVFVGLGCPKQERWMAGHRGRVNAVMIGVGAAFDFHAGTVRRAPLWMRDNGLEWLYRLALEPARLWKRYLVTNTLFIILAARQLFSGKH
jgi:N-acetylglucosaminyldiphosphoundecaprenol N-acetyl-beta-D-mannosaminyltransferase